jgi:hypothetical protein
MNRNKMDDSEMDSSLMDRILNSEEELIPSSGFVASVMEGVHEEARRAVPIRFPWKRAIPGMLLAGGVFGWGGFELIRQAIPAFRELTLSQPHLSGGVERPLEQAGWVALALAAALASWMLSRRLVERSGLL